MKLFSYIKSNYVNNSINYLKVTSLSSGLFTNFGSIRDPFTGCRIGSLMGLICSQPKHVAKISASSRVVPSFLL